MHGEVYAVLANVAVSEPVCLLGSRDQKTMKDESRLVVLGL